MFTMSTANRGIAEENVAPPSERKPASNVTSIQKASPEAAHHMEQIVRRRAYEFYEQRGREDGHAQEDWLHAEAEILGTRLRKARVG